MNYTPLDIQNIEIKKTAIGGLNEVEVMAVLDDIAEDYQNYVKDITRLKSEVDTMKAAIDQYKVLEGTLQNTLLAAQQNCEEMKAVADEHAKNIVKEAEIKAEEIVLGAHNRVYELERYLQQLNLKAMTFKMQYQSVLEAEIKFLDEMPHANKEEEVESGMQEAAAAVERTELAVEDVCTSLQDEEEKEIEDKINTIDVETEKQPEISVAMETEKIVAAAEDEDIHPVPVKEEVILKEDHHGMEDENRQEVRIPDDQGFEEKYKTSSLFTSKFFKQDSEDEKKTETVSPAHQDEKESVSDESVPTTLRARNVGADYRRNRFRKEMLDELK